MAEKRMIGIVIADKDEYEPLESWAVDNGGELCSLGSRRAFKIDAFGAGIVAVCCGIGKVNAAASAMMLATLGADVLFNIGYVGGISNVRRGELVVATRFLEHDFDLSVIGYKPSEKPGQEYIYLADEVLSDKLSDALSVKKVIAVTGDCFVCDEQKREFLKTEFGANICDMESAAVASVAEQMGVKFAAVKRVSDDAGDTAAEDYRDMNTNEGEALSSVAVRCIEFMSAEL